MNILLLREALLAAKEHGVMNLNQFEVFISISQADGITVNDLSGTTKSEDPLGWDAKAEAVRQLTRVGEDGMSLVYRAEPVSSNGGRRPRMVRLTPKGLSLLTELRSLGFV